MKGLLALCVVCAALMSCRDGKNFTAKKEGVRAATGIAGASIPALIFGAYQLYTRRNQDD